MNVLFVRHDLSMSIYEIGTVAPARIERPLPVSRNVSGNTVLTLPVVRYQLVAGYPAPVYEEI